MKTLSIQNPLAYLVATGLKTVENRDWSTDYRGPLLIHASGKDIGGMPDLTDYPHLRLIEEFVQVQLGTLDNSTSRYFKIDQADEAAFVADPDSLTDQERRERLVCSRTNVLAQRGGHFWTASSIIGVVDLAAVTPGGPSDNPFADPDSAYHWHLKNARLFRVPFRYVKGKLRLWDFDHADLAGRETM
jgi:hypothetical protein